MQAEKSGAVFDDVEIVRLKAAYLAALKDIRGRPEWRRTIGFEDISTIVAKTILSKARAGLLSNTLLSTLAVAAVREEFMAVSKRRSKEVYVLEG